MNTYTTILFASLTITMVLMISTMNNAEANHGYVDSWKFNSAEITGNQFNFPMVKMDIDYKGTETQCSISMEKLVNEGDPNFPAHYVGKYVRISFTHPYDCNTDPVIPLYIMENETLSLKINLTDGKPYTVIYVDNYIIVKQPPTLWSYNGAEFSNRISDNRTFIKFDLDYTGNSKYCTLDLFKLFPEKISWLPDGWVGHYVGIGQTVEFDCHNAVPIGSSAKIGDTGNYLINLREGYDRLIETNIKLKNFTVE